MRLLIRFGTAGQVHRAGELIAANRPRYPAGPPVVEPPPGFDHGMLIGVSGSLYGYRNFAGEVFGEINPEVITTGQFIASIGGVPVTGLVYVYFGVDGDEQVETLDQMILAVEGSPAVTVAWNAGTLRYQAIDAALCGYLQGRVGKVLGVRFDVVPAEAIRKRMAKRKRRSKDG